MKRVNILGTTYTIEYKAREKDILLETYDGYCDKTTHKIVVLLQPNDSDLECWEEYSKKTLRHEIIHAFMFESGLAENWEHKSFGQDETAVDWFAIQSPKIYKVFEELECI